MIETVSSGQGRPHRQLSDSLNLIIGATPDFIEILLEFDDGIRYPEGSMCGRFARKSTQEVLAEWFDLELEEMPWFAPSYNVAPQSTQPVVRLGHDSGGRETALLRWGLVPFWAKDAKMAYSTINARAEEVASKPAYREALKKRRCLVPADAFYEWQRLDAEDQAAICLCAQER